LSSGCLVIPSIATAACGQGVAVARRERIGVERSGCIEARRSPDEFDDVLKLGGSRMLHDLA